MRTKQRNNLAETACHERVAQNTDVYAVKARNYKGLRRGSPVFCRNNWHIHHAKSGGGQILICIAGRGYYQEEGKEILRRTIMSVLLKSLIAVVQERNQPVDITPGFHILHIHLQR